jgi:hypothetical protein
MPLFSNGIVGDLAMVSLTAAYALSAYTGNYYFYVPYSIFLLLAAIAGTIGIFSKSSVVIFRYLRKRESTIIEPLNNIFAVGVLIYIEWYVVALIYATMQIMLLTKRAIGAYKHFR